ncbi:MAG: copper resistance protein NlpE N-terminal domain-containing protein [Ignavibacteriae bacterium]|nr:copper resistance protein NlpE N-terminal domain-containing protein [Ignavibacteriota bacterium]
MKTLIIILIAVFAYGCSCCNKNVSNNFNKILSQSDNSKTSIDLIGKYVGVLPCADCEGIKTEIILSENLTYEMNQVYLSKDEKVFTSKGSFNWSDGGSIIILENQDPNLESNKFLVGENKIVKLDIGGNIIKGDLENNYILHKVDESITEKYWKLIELYGKKISFGENQKREAHIILKNDDNRVIGNSGCNSISGSYELLEGNRIKVSKVISTMMACENLKTETLFLQVLDKVDNYTIANDTLSLNKARMAPLAKFAVVYLK